MVDKSSKEYQKAYRRKYYRRLRLKVLKHYSKGKPHCECCGEHEERFLVIDHVYGGGQRERRAKHNNNLAAYLYKERYPGGYRVLCHNCNFAVQFGDCPHKQNKSKRRG